MKCTCVIKTAPTYDTYVQVLCGIHRAMLEADRERTANAVCAEFCGPDLHHPACNFLRETEIPSKTVYEVKDNGDVTRGTISPSQKLDIQDSK